MVRFARGVVGTGLLGAACALPLAAQSMALPAVDPVGIARSGAQVAYGFSLEAATLNPALLSALKEKTGFYLSAGMETSSIQQSMESNQGLTPITYYSHDRNRGIFGFGFSRNLTPALTLGLKLDEPYIRHAELRDDAPTRYFGDGISFTSHRLEGQAAWAFNPNVSVGIGLGVARLAYESTTVMRLNVPNPAPLADSLVEQRVGQSGEKVVPSYSLGVRWAINPRWTIGFAHQSSLKGDLDMKAEFRDTPLGYFDSTGLGNPLAGTPARANAMLAASTPVSATKTFELPSRTTLGFRHRLRSMITWEADLTWTSAGILAPDFPTVQTPYALTAAPAELPRTKGHLALSASAEYELGKFWTLRGGLTLDQRSVDESLTEPLLGGSRTAGFSVGAGYRVWGGELNLGYQFRQSEDQDTHGLVGVWSATGFHNAGTRVRLEGMGHLMAIGFKKTF